MAVRNPIAAGVLIGLAVIGILVAIWFITTAIPFVIEIVLISIVFAAGIAPGVARITNVRLWPGWHIPRGIAVIMIYIGIAIILTLIGIFVVTFAVKEIGVLIDNIPGYITSLQSWLAEVHAKYTYIPSLTQILVSLRDKLGSIYTYVYTVVRSAISIGVALGIIVLIVVLAYYALLGDEKIKNAFLLLLPPSKRIPYGDVLSEMAYVMGAWLRAQVFLAIIVGVAIGIFMAIMRVPYIFLIALIGALAELAPMLGPTVAAIPAVLLSLNQPTWKIVVIIAFFILLAEIDGHILTPMIMQRRVGVHPFLIVVVLFIGAVWGGLLGALLAVPVTGAVQVFVARVVLPAIENAEEKVDAGSNP